MIPKKSLYLGTNNKTAMHQILEKNCNNKSCLECANRSPLFEALTNDEIELVNAKRFELSFNPGEIIRKQGAFLSHVVFITSGLASIYIEGLNDKDLILKLVKPRQFIGGPGMFVDQRHHYTAKAHIPTAACFVEVGIIKGLIHTNPVFANDFFRDFGRNTLSTYNRLVSLAHRYVPGRLADTLIYLSEEVFESTCFDLTLTSRELGALAGMSSDSVQRTLREFIRNGIISRTRNSLEIHNPDALKRISMTG